MVFDGKLSIVDNNKIMKLNKTVRESVSGQEFGFVRLNGGFHQLKGKL